jgi:hypothetical protein
VTSARRIIRHVEVSFEELFPMPRGFMWQWVSLGNGRGLTLAVPCVADEFIADDDVYTIEPFNDGRSMIVGHPRAWAELGARNLADYHRPIGAP